MTIPPPGWHSTLNDREGGPRGATPELSRAKGSTAGTFRVLLIVLVATIAVGLIAAAVLSYIIADFRGPE